MIKRIIFDLDNTLIDWKEEYWKSINRALERYKISFSQNDVKNIIISIDNYEAEHDMYKKEYMLECINKYSNMNLNLNFIDLWIEELSKCVPNVFDIEIIETLEYLYKKYELVILTNWFKKSQYNRIEKVGIEKYFKQMYTPETFRNKPNEEAFYKAANNKIEECVMIGDSIETDIIGAINVGMKAIYFNRKNTKIDNENIETITEFTQLKNIL